jgi:hypothetical protein
VNRLDRALQQQLEEKRAEEAKEALEMARFRAQFLPLSLTAEDRELLEQAGDSPGGTS